MSFLCAQLERKILRVEGEDASSFLQGLVTADLRHLEHVSLYGAFLTPQGKFLEDLFITFREGVLLLECAKEHAEVFKQKLSLYKLRSRVSLSWADGLKVFAFWGSDPSSRPDFDLGASFGKEAVFFQDPRLPELGFRVYSQDAPMAVVSETEYDLFRMSFGVPDGAKDLTREKSILLENGFDELGAISWEKGCYLGQELTSRTKYRGLVRKRLFPFRFDGQTPSRGDVCILEDKEVGVVMSAMKGLGLGLFRLEFLDQLLENDVHVEGAQTNLKIYKPDWMKVIL